MAQETGWGGRAQCLAPQSADHAPAAVRRAGAHASS